VAETVTLLLGLRTGQLRREDVKLHVYLWLRVSRGVATSCHYSIDSELSFSLFDKYYNSLATEKQIGKAVVKLHF
jgi:hypothetical protein